MNVEVPDGLSSKSMPVLLEISEDGRMHLKAQTRTGSQSSVHWSDMAGILWQDM